MKYFKITFRWYATDTFCANIVYAESEEQATAHYKNKGCAVIHIEEASEYELDSARKRGMPFITINRKE